MNVRMNPLSKLVDVPPKFDYRLAHVHVIKNQWKDRNVYLDIIIKISSPNYVI